MIIDVTKRVWPNHNRFSHDLLWFSINGVDQRTYLFDIGLQILVWTDSLTLEFSEHKIYKLDNEKFIALLYDWNTLKNFREITIIYTAK